MLINLLLLGCVLMSFSCGSFHRDNFLLQNWISSTELIFIILNYVACVPVLLAVGAFRCVSSCLCILFVIHDASSLYHFNGLLGNTTTIEGWEKDKAATMIRYGRIQDVKFPYVCFFFSSFISSYTEHSSLIEFRQTSKHRICSRHRSLALVLPDKNTRQWTQV